MGILLLFAFLSGLVTIAAPCIWPILPIVLSATSTGGHRKPLGITLGIVISFGLLTLFLSSVIAIIPFNANILRTFAVIVIAGLGITLLVPRLSSTLEGWVSRLQGKLQLTGNKATGFWSGFLTGLALGVVWAPCAGPILATIATLSATHKVSIDLVWVTAFYCLGVAIPLFLFATLGRAVFLKTKAVSKYTGRIQQIFGAVMIVTALLIATGQDTVLEAKLLNFFPSYSQFLSNLEGNSTVTGQLNTLKQQKNPPMPFTQSNLFNTNYSAPDFVGITNWLNLPNGTKSPTIRSLRGKVVLVDFWTYTCINCIRTLPHVTSWYDKYKDNGFVVIGVHTPEFAFEHETQNVQNAIQQFNIHYPVGQDNNYATWNNYNNQYWPAEYLIDAQGTVRRTEFGEGEYDQTEQAIQELLRENGHPVSRALENMPNTTPTGSISPETYVGSNRMQYYFPDGTLGNGTQNFSLSQSLPVDSFAFSGQWTIEPEDAVAGQNAILIYHFQANKVYVILRPAVETCSANSCGAKQADGTVKVLLDGRPISASLAGTDVVNGVTSVEEDRLYNIVDLHGLPAGRQGKIGDHVLQLEFQKPGLKAYTFTFG